MQQMGKLKGVADIETSLEKAKPELRVRVDRERASDLGVPAGVIGTTLRAAVSGEVASVIEDSQGELVWTGRITIQSDRNKEATTAIPFGEIVKNPKPGIYVVLATVTFYE